MKSRPESGSNEVIFFILKNCLWSFSVEHIYRYMRFAWLKIFGAKNLLTHWQRHVPNALLRIWWQESFVSKIKKNLKAKKKLNLCATFLPALKEETFSTEQNLCHKQFQSVLHLKFFFYFFSVLCFWFMCLLERKKFIPEYYYKIN